MNMLKKFFSLLSKKPIVKTIMLMVKARGSDEGATGFERFTGIGSFNVLAVNPTKEELSEIYGRSVEADQVYIYPAQTKEESDACRITFILKTNDDPINSEKEYSGPITFTIRDKYLTSSKSGVEKVKVIDEYGQTAWVNEEELKGQKRPLQSNGNQAKILPPFRPAYQGEEELVSFLTTYLNVVRPMEYKDGKWVPTKDLEDAKISLSIKDYFRENFSELKSVVQLVPDNKIKALMYVRNTEDNKTYQQILPDLVLHPRSSNYGAFEKLINEGKANGRFDNSIFTYGPLETYMPQPTSFGNDSQVFGSQEKKEEPKQTSWFKS